uniref:Uncharacterized protein n=1 Tax=Romanomermis culicivorax TaxID=13658 RepID=A0A915JCL0_ROMCU
MSRHFSPSVDHATNGNLVTANVSYWSEPASAKPGLQVPYHQAITGSGVDQRAKSKSKKAAPYGAARRCMTSHRSVPRGEPKKSAAIHSRIRISTLVGKTPNY